MKPTLSNIIAIVSLLLAAVLGVIVINDSIDRKIQAAINDPTFLKKVADETRVPFLEFDSKGTVQKDGGAMSYINKIEPYKEKERAAGFVVYPKQFLKEAPILQALNSSVPFAEPKRVHTIDWQYRIPQWIEGTSFENTGKYDEQPAQLFKLEIIR